MKKRIRLFSIMTIIIMILCGCTREIEVGNTEVNSVSELSEQELYVEFSPAYGDKTAAVTIISDDGFYRTGKNLNELAQKHNMHITVAGVVQIVNDDYTGWKEIVDDGYIDLVSHSYSHVKMDGTFYVKMGFMQFVKVIGGTIACLLVKGKILLIGLI